jgi:hypothetical protein
MGILRVKEDIGEIIERDPYELINIDEPHQLVRRLSPQYYGAAFVGVLVAFAAAFITFYNASRHTADTGDSVHAYFEIKAIDAEGHPVAGASVLRGEEQVGVTDSFGEWRRFLRVVPGETFKVHLTKATPEGTLVAVKNLAVPARLPETGDLEVTGSVKMYYSGRAPDAKSGTDARHARAPSVPSMPATQAVPAEAAMPVPSAPVAGTVSDLGRIWFIADGQQSPLLTEVVNALRRRSLELGMRVDPKAGFRIRLTAMAGESARKAKPGPVLIRVAGTSGADHAEVFSYLRNFQETPYQTARDILWAMTVHTKYQVAVTREGAHWRVRQNLPVLWDFSARFLTNAQGGLVFAAKKTEGAAPEIDAADFADVCPAGAGECLLTTAGVHDASPVYGWQRLSARVSGPVDAQTKIYISGYEADLTSDNRMAYWGIPGGQANITVMRAGKVILRKRVTHSDKLVVALPAAVISRR